MAGISVQKLFSNISDLGVIFKNAAGRLKTDSILPKKAPYQNHVA